VPQDGALLGFNAVADLKRARDPSTVGHPLAIMSRWLGKEWDLSPSDSVVGSVR